MVVSFSWKTQVVLRGKAESQVGPESGWFQLVKMKKIGFFFSISDKSPGDFGVCDGIRYSALCWDTYKDWRGRAHRGVWGKEDITKESLPWLNWGKRDVRELCKAKTKVLGPGGQLGVTEVKK